MERFGDTKRSKTSFVYTKYANCPLPSTPELTAAVLLLQIYVPMNYLLLRALATWYPSRAAREVYRVARAGVVANVLHLHQTTGTFWEAYEPGVGHWAKQQSWSALVVLVMAEMY